SDSWPVLRAGVMQTPGVNLVLRIEAVHQVDVYKDHHYVEPDRALLCKPKARLDPADAPGIELIDEHDGQHERHDKPQAEHDLQDANVFAPVSAGTGLGHFSAFYCCDDGMVILLFFSSELNPLAASQL